MIDRNLFTIPGMKRALAALVFCELLEAVTTLGQAFGLGFAIQGLWSGDTFAQVLPLATVFFGCLALRQILGALKDQSMDRFSLKVCEEWRNSLIDHCFCGSPLLGAKEDKAALTASVNESMGAIAAYLRSMPIKIAALLALALPILCAEFFFDWVTGLILLITTPVIILFMRLLGLQAKQRAEVSFENYQRLSSHFMDTLRGLSTLWAFGASEKEDRLIWENSERQRKSAIKTISIATLSGALLDLVATLGTAAVAMMLAFRLLDGTLSLGLGLTCLILAPEFYGPLRNFAAGFHEGLDAKQALSKLQGFLSQPSFQPKSTALPSLSDAWQLTGKNLGYSYASPNSDVSKIEASISYTTALESVDFTLNSGDTLVILGESGAGKSTLINLLAGFASPNQGSFFLGDQRLSDLNVQCWLDSVHYIPQDPYIIAGTVRDNVALYAPHVSDEAIIAALEALDLGPWLDKLPEGIFSNIGSGHLGLSGGQAQRLALARALVAPRPILIFDEPTAHLDIETEFALKPFMVSLMEKSTVIFATHRLHWLKNATKVLALKDGMIVPFEEVVYEA